MRAFPVLPAFPALLTALAFVLPTAAAGQERTAELAGRIIVTAPPGRAAGQAGTVVWLPGVQAQGGAAATARMASRNKRFEPHVLAVTRGTTVAFPNDDGIYHNVFSLSPGNAFDLGLYRRGAERSARLGAPGLVRVYCNIHPEMTAYVLVTEGSAFAVTGEDGSYRITGLPPGRHAVRVWSEVGGETTTEIELAAGRPTTWDASLDGSRFRPLPHKNKHGRDYPPATEDVDRY